MGMLVRGRWTEDDGDSRGSGGRFDHLPTKFRNFVTADGGSGFKAEPGRYYLYCSRTCPWAHRTVLLRYLKGLEEVVGLVWNVQRGTEGVTAAEQLPHTVPGTDVQINHLHELYTLANPDYTGRVTVPTLWDAKRRTVVNNESAEIVRMLNAEFPAFANNDIDYYPESLRAQIDAVNELVYHAINNGVYKAGFSTSQAAYDEAYARLFAALDELERRLGRSRYLCGNAITEADWRLFPTLFRFDSVYHYAFKCNLRHLYQYPNLWGYCRDLYQQPGIAGRCFLDAAKRGYWSNPRVNPTGTIPNGPELDFDAPHDRERFRRAA